MEDQPSFLIQSDTHEPFGIRVLDIHFSIANISLQNSFLSTTTLSRHCLITVGNCLDHFGLILTSRIDMWKTKECGVNCGWYAA
jgi:hypothetical protein